ncbi:MULTISPECIES: hypothetical protein [unclassified Mucilaginibacter]|uniref:hypothetical protein n=1 Tax=unclassified Mucilaginibacter TaxID=2617802 RepID=UPI000AD2EB7C|nr:MULTISPECIES: hypothetical protein [unclassified Mucilaginibacter]
MHIVYSALRTKKVKDTNQLSDKELQQRYKGYLSACAKYRQEIAAIQKYLPGWAPKFT